MEQDADTYDVNTRVQLTHAIDDLLKPMDTDNYFMNLEDDDIPDEGYQLYIACYTSSGRRIPVPAQCVSSLMGRRFRVEGTTVEFMFQLEHPF